MKRPLRLRKTGSLRSELKLQMSCQCLCLEPLRVLYSPAVNLLTPPEDRS